MKLYSKPHFSAFLTVFLAVGLLTACNSPMGLGKPIDTLAPTVVIDAPADNEFIRGILLGSPVIVTGYVVDDLSGPDKISLSFELYNKTAARSIKPDVVWEIDEDGKWRAEITITAAEGAEDYTIKVFAQDAFKNRGSAIVNVRIDIVPPWIRDAHITRHPGSGFNFSSALYPQEHYTADGYLADGAYRDIPYLKIDEYQNEVFTVRVEIEPSYADVAASRLYVKSRGDAYLHEEGLVPSGYWRGEGLEALRYPEWKISASQLTGWNASYASGGSYLLFEVWAYSEAAWDKGNDRPFPGEPGRVQKIGGTAWLPESDKPRVLINPEIFVNDIIVLERSADSALAVDFYDDDRLGVIYTRLLPKLELLALYAGLSEEEFLNSLTDPADRQGKRAALISKLQLTNELTQTTGDGRFQRIEVSTKGLELGEYRLIALVRDDKSKTGYSFESGAPESWAIYPPVNIQVSDVNAPFIFVEEPIAENVFPNLIAGESFVMSGFILGRMETRSLNIAWVPKALQTGGLDAVITILESDRAAALSTGESFVAANGITVWSIELQEDTEKTVLNGVEYFKVKFENTFHIIDNFQYNGSLENDDKLLVLDAANYSTRVYSTFNIPGLKTGPDIEVTQPVARGSGHDPNEDLTLKMRVNPAAGGAALKPGSQTITDVTLTETNAGFSGPITLVGDEWTRTITSEYIMGHYDKASTRVFRFKAQDILGNETRLERDIIFTDQPLLESISCTETTGTFGIGQTLRFEATFSMPVVVALGTGQTARLKLYLTDPGNNTGVATAKYANYVAGNTGKTIVFTYTVQEGDNTSKLCTSLDAIVLSPGGMITSTGFTEADLVLKHSDGLLQTHYTIALDGIRPFITRASFAPLTGFNYSGVSYFTNGKTITLKLITNDTVNVTGSPRAVIRYGDRELRAQYAYKTTDTVNGIDTLYFTYGPFSDALQGSSNITPLTYLEWSLPWLEFPTDSAITDMVGNNIIATGYDTSGSAVFLSEANRRGQAGQVAGITYTSEQGYIKTTFPAAPTFTLHRTQTDANNGPTSNPLTAVPLLVNTGIFVRIQGRETPSAGLGGATLKYSLTGGGDPQSISVTGTTAYGTAAISDADSANKYMQSYKRSQYIVTAWQEDLAGNRSDPATATAAQREVTINSRWPELLSIEIGLPDGNYLRNTTIPIRLNFSDRIKKRAGVNTPMSCEIFATYEPVPGSPQPNRLIATSTIANMDWEGETSGGYTNVLRFNWVAAPNVTGVSGNFYDIKLTKIIFSSRFEDEYGNTVIAYSGGALESASNPNRPIDYSHTLYSFQLNRPNVRIMVDGPLAVSSTPFMGGDFYQPGNTSAWPFTRGTGVNENGGVITKTGNDYTFTLTYDVPISKVAGKYITIKPYGNWALPPILTIEEMDYLLNHAAIKNNTEYKRRLTYVDEYGVPPRPPMGVYDPPTDLEPHHNCYTQTTHGITSTSGGLARPDTTTKWVLDFSIDPHGTDDRTAKLRQVFEAAEWKVQKIHVGSQQVIVSDKTATVILSEDLLDGRIWSVTPESGAFIDAAGNPSGRGYAPFTYRFWSPGTATPVIRVNRVSYDEGIDKDKYGFGTNMTVDDWRVWQGSLPAMDTEVRIDSETPGADIHYNVIRTHRQLTAATSTTAINYREYNNVFVSTEEDDYNFFGSNVTAGGANSVLGAPDGFYRVFQPPEQWDLYTEWTPAYDGPTTGYARNTIGNDNHTSAANKEDGFLKNLLSPNLVDTGGSYVSGGILNNGAPSYLALTAMGDDVKSLTNWTNSSTSKVYRTVSETGAANYNGQNFVNNSGHFFVGEAYGTWSKIVVGDADPKLYTGRRDYIVAAARKEAVTSGNAGYQGPALATSTYTMEGVYKTTVILRQPFFSGVADWGGTAVWVTGQSSLPITSVSGFPFKGLNDGQIDAFDGYQSIVSRPMYKNAYRIGGLYYLYCLSDRARLSLGIHRNDQTNNHLWVSWEIVTDWYLSAAGRFITFKDSMSPDGMINLARRTGNFNPYDPRGNLINEGYVTATYGGITYRYGQYFDGEAFDF